jgi:hypothetical protein
VNIYDRRYTHYFPPFFSVPASLVACLTSASVNDLLQAGISSLAGEVFTVLPSFCLPASELDSGCLGVVVDFPGSGFVALVVEGIVVVDFPGKGFVALVEAAVDLPGNGFVALVEAAVDLPGNGFVALVEALVEAVLIVDFPGNGFVALVEAAVDFPGNGFVALVAVVVVDFPGKGFVALVEATLVVVVVGESSVKVFLGEVLGDGTGEVLGDTCLGEVLEAAPDID